MTDKLLKVSEVADILRVSQMTVIRKCRDGSIPFIRIGSMRRIREIDLEYYILFSSKNTETPKAPEPTPVYVGPPAEECGFDDDADAWKAEMHELCVKATAKIEADRAKKASEVKAPAPPIRITNERGTGLFPSGFAELFDKE